MEELLCALSACFVTKRYRKYARQRKATGKGPNDQLANKPKAVHVQHPGRRRPPIHQLRYKLRIKLSLVEPQPWQRRQPADHRMPNNTAT